MLCFILLIDLVYVDIVVLDLTLCLLNPKTQFVHRYPFTLLLDNSCKLVILPEGYITIESSHLLLYVIKGRSEMELIVQGFELRLDIDYVLVHVDNPIHVTPDFFYLCRKFAFLTF